MLEGDYGGDDQDLVTDFRLRTSQWSKSSQARQRRPGNACKEAEFLQPDVSESSPEALSAESNGVLPTPAKRGIQLAIITKHLQGNVKVGVQQRISESRMSLSMTSVILET